MKKIALLSPHLDDAVFSVGGLMAALAHEGHTLHVVTCFTRSVPNPTGFALACQLDKGLSPEVDYMQLRRQEDARACGLLGARPYWLPLPEAPHRGYHSASALFGDLLLTDTVQSALREHLHRTLTAINPDLILSPQAIGNHVDHWQVRHATEWLKPYFPRTLFLRWYDQPYLARGSGQYADQVATEQEPGWAVLAQQAQEPGDHTLCLNIDPLADQKLAACAAYTTQIGFQFGGANQIQAGLGRLGRLLEWVQ